MTWPINKASTEYTDQASDSIAAARADINQNIINVNDMIDHFDIANAVEGELLRYQGGVFVAVNEDTINVQKIALLEYGSVGDGTVDLGSNASPRRYAQKSAALYDQYNLVTVDNIAGQITLQPGAYLFERDYGAGPSSSTTFGFYEDGLEINLWSWQGNNLIGESFMFARTITTPTNYRLRSGTNIASFDLVLKITKL